MCAVLLVGILLGLLLRSWIRVLTSGLLLSSASTNARQGSLSQRCRMGWGREAAVASARPAPTLANLTELIVVAGHAVFVGHNFDDATDPTDVADWTLLAYQKRQLPAFIGHVRRGVELAAQRPAMAPCLAAPHRPIR